MGLTNKQKKWIKKRSEKLSAKKIAEQINISVDDVESFLKHINKKTPVYYYFIVFLIPILFFTFLEIGLRIFDYGFNNDQWVEITDEYLGLNHEIGKRYFKATSTVPLSIQDVFAKEKKENTFRVFVLGGSSAAGYPYLPVGSFSRYLQQRLQIVYPSSIIEVVNLSLTAVNSYTIRDLTKGVLEQKPDLILIYAGHNEYYGALGIGSMESLGTSREVVNLILYLNKYKTTELIRNSIKTVSKFFAGNIKKPSGTLMSRMAKEKAIPFNSKTYFAGVKQFEENIKDVLKMAKENKIPVILGTLVSNLKDQPPFVSAKTNAHTEANNIFEEAKNQINLRNFRKADSLFRLAKDLDQLRFRAPEKINESIVKLGNEFGFEIVKIDSAFSANSDQGVIGDDLMTDHLHPNLRGYHLIGKLYFEKMLEKGFLPKTKHADFSNYQQDSLVTTNFPFSPFDSVLADYKIRALKNDWPFIDKKAKKNYDELYNLQNFIDSIALNVVSDKMEWQNAQTTIAATYLKQKDYKNYLNQMNVLISNYPIIVEYYDAVANEMLQIKEFDIAYEYFHKRYKMKPSPLSTKWLGIIDLSKNNSNSAINYLSHSMKLNSNDTQVLYNLAGAYSLQKNYKKSLEIINSCLELKPDYTEAINLKVQLESALRNKTE